MINELQLQSRAFNSIKIVRCQLFVVSCQLSVGAKHLEDKLSVIAKNSSPNASPVQLFVVRCPLFVVLPMTNDQSPMTTDH